MSEYHYRYIKEKQEKTLKLWDLLMLRHGLFSDFEKTSTVKTNVKSSQDTKTSKDESATQKNVDSKQPIKNHNRFGDSQHG